MGVSPGCATSQRRAARAETAGPVSNRRGIHRARARITGLVDLTDQFDANHSFAIYTPALSAARGNASRARSRARRPPSSVVWQRRVRNGAAFGN